LVLKLFLLVHYVERDDSKRENIYIATTQYGGCKLQDSIVKNKSLDLYHAHAQSGKLFKNDERNVCVFAKLSRFHNKKAKMFLMKFILAATAVRSLTIWQMNLVVKRTCGRVDFIRRISSYFFCTSPHKNATNNRQ
jgi:hypothetical protein